MDESRAVPGRTASGGHVRADRLRPQHHRSVHRVADIGRTVAQRRGVDRAARGQHRGRGLWRQGHGLLGQARAARCGRDVSLCRRRVRHAIRRGLSGARNRRCFLHPHRPGAAAGGRRHVRGDRCREPRARVTSGSGDRDRRGASSGRRRSAPRRSDVHRTALQVGPTRHRVVGRGVRRSGRRGASTRCPGDTPTRSAPPRVAGGAGADSRVPPSHRRR